MKKVKTFLLTATLMVGPALTVAKVFVAGSGDERLAWLIASLWAVSCIANELTIINLHRICEDNEEFVRKLLEETKGVGDGGK